MISASFLSLGSFSTTVPSESSSAVSLVPVQVRLDLNPDRSIEIVISGAESKNIKFEAKQSDWDFDSVTATLSDLKGRYSALTTVTLAADPQVQYREVVRSVEKVKITVPNVVLGE